MSDDARIATACELAGFFAAHAAWSLADGEVPAPITAVQRADGSRAMQRLAGDDLGALVEAAQAWLREGPDHAVAAALVYAGEVARADGRDDALIIELASYGERDDAATLALLYRVSPFALAAPRWLARTPRVDAEAALAAFERGATRHDKAAPAWRAAVARWTDQPSLT
jgi:hypothetical protein